jgi:DNA gyrase subunit B
MYIGGTDARALCSCAFELISNSIEQHLNNKCSSLTVILHNDGSLTVIDDGPGISVREDPRFEIPYVELALTTLHSQPRESREFIFCNTGVGAKAVNALSEWMVVDTVSSGEAFQIRFARGKTSKPLVKRKKSAMARGTAIRFKPDPEFFGETSFDRMRIAHYLEPLAFMHPGLDIWLIDERLNSARRPLVTHYEYPTGIADYLRITSSGWKLHPEPVLIQGAEEGVRCAIGFQFTETINTSIVSYANSLPCSGTHVQGFLLGLTAGLNQMVSGRRRFKACETRVGLHAVVCVWLFETYYGGSNKDELITPKAEKVVRKLTINGIKAWSATSQGYGEAVIDFLREQRRKF